MIVYCPNCHQPGRIVSNSIHQVECPACFSTFSVEPIPADNDINLVTFKTVDQSLGELSVTNSDDSNLDAYGSLLESSDYKAETVEPLELADKVNGQVGIEARPNAASPIKLSLDNKPSSKTRKKEKSGIGSMIGVVLGGFASLPIATAIMWYGMGKDPFQVGPKVAQYVPWIVPDRFAGRYGRSTRSFPPLNHPGSSSYFTDESLKKQPEESPDFGKELSSAYATPDTSSGTDLIEEKPTQGAVEQRENTDSMKQENLSAEVMASSEVNSNNVVSSLEESAAAELPFKPDTKTTPLNADLVQYQLNLVKSFDELNAESDSFAFGKFLGDLQLLLSRLDSDADGTSSRSQLSGLTSKLDLLKTAPYLKGLVTESRSRLTQSLEDASINTSHIDVFELESTSPLGPVESLPTLSENYEVWHPSNNTKEPVRSLKVLCPIGISPTNESKNARYILIGRVTKSDGIAERIFLVQFVVPL
jgi:hypothetical protein